MSSGNDYKTKIGQSTITGLRIWTALTGPSVRNKADIMTRVNKSWLSVMQEEKCEYICNAGVSLKDVHNLNHMGVEQTLYLARKLNPDVSSESVKKIVRSCLRCQCIDPALITDTCGELSVDKNWRRLSVDVKHYRQQQPYLYVVDSYKMECIKSI